MNVSLTPQLEQLVQEKVASGLYNSASEVIREALRLLEQQDRLNAVKLSSLQRDVKVGLDQIERGDATHHDDESLKALSGDIKTRGRNRLTARKSRK